MVEVRRKEREPISSLVRRFDLRLRRSGILLRARKIRFYKPRKSKEAEKREALRREILKKQYEKLKKLGRLP